MPTTASTTLYCGSRMPRALCEGKHEVLEPDEAMTADWSITIEKV